MKAAAIPGKRNPRKESGQSQDAPVRAGPARAAAGEAFRCCRRGHGPQSGHVRHRARRFHLNGGAVRPFGRPWTVRLYPGRGRRPLADRPVRQLCRSPGRGPRQGAGREAAQDPAIDPGPPPGRRRRRARPLGVPRDRATSSSCGPGKSSPATARSSRGSPPWTNRPSPANPPRSSAKPEPTARASPAERGSSRTASSSASRPERASPSSTG